MADYSIIPTELRGLRACLLCGLVKTISQFQANGCENCEEYLQMQGDREVVNECTSANFDGLISMMCPSESWVARWQMIDKLAAGIYAISVTGKLPNGKISYLRSQGVAYKSRDRTK